MKTKLLFLFTVVIGMSITNINAQSFSNLVFDSEIATTTTTVTLTFDYDGVSAGDTFEWQLFLALPDGSPDWGSGRNIAYETAIVPSTVGAGSQGVTFNIYNTPVDGEVFTWAGKITLASDGSDTGYDNTGNLVTVSDNLSVDDVNSNEIIIYPNPAKEELFINASKLQANSIQVYDMSGRSVLSLENTLNTESINVSELKQGVYIMVTDTKKQFRFLKQ